MATDKLNMPKFSVPQMTPKQRYSSRLEKAQRERAEKLAAKKAKLLADKKYVEDHRKQMLAGEPEPEPTRLFPDPVGIAAQLASKVTGADVPEFVKAATDPSFITYRERPEKTIPGTDVPISKEGDLTPSEFAQLTTKDVLADKTRAVTVKDSDGNAFTITGVSENMTDVQVVESLWAKGAEARLYHDKHGQYKNRAGAILAKKFRPETFEHLSERNLLDTMWGGGMAISATSGGLKTIANVMENATDYAMEYAQSQHFDRYKNDPKVQELVKMARTDPQAALDLKTLLPQLDPAYVRDSIFPNLDPTPYMSGIGAVRSRYDLKRQTDRKGGFFSKFGSSPQEVKTKYDLKRLPPYVDDSANAHETEHHGSIWNEDVVPPPSGTSHPMMALEIVKHHLNQFQLGEDSFEYARYGINVPGIRHWNPNREIVHSHRIYLPIYKAKNFPEAMVELMPALVYSYLKTRAGILGPAHKNDYFSARSFGANAGATFVVDSLALEPGMHLSGWVEQLGVDAPFIKWVSGSHLEEGEERSVTEELTAQAVEGVFVGVAFDTVLSVLGAWRKVAVQMRHERDELLKTRIIKELDKQTLGHAEISAIPTESLSNANVTKLETNLDGMVEEVIGPDPAQKLARLSDEATDEADAAAINNIYTSTQQSFDEAAKRKELLNKSKYIKDKTLRARVVKEITRASIDPIRRLEKRIAESEKLTGTVVSQNGRKVTVEVINKDGKNLGHKVFDSTTIDLKDPTLRSTMNRDPDRVIFKDDEVVKTLLSQADHPRGAPIGNRAFTKTEQRSAALLPRRLRRAKPSYIYKRKRIDLTFDNDISKALYIIGRKGNQKEYVNFLRRAGMSNSEITTEAIAIRQRLRSQAAQSQPDTMHVSANLPERVRELVADIRKKEFDEYGRPIEIPEEYVARKFDVGQEVNVIPSYTKKVLAKKHKELGLTYEQTATARVVEAIHAGDLELSNLESLLGKWDMTPSELARELATASTKSGQVLNYLGQVAKQMKRTFKDLDIDAAHGLDQVIEKSKGSFADNFLVEGLRKVEDVRRGALISLSSTASRNMLTAGTRLGIQVLFDENLQSAIRGILKGKGPLASRYQTFSHEFKANVGLFHSLGEAVKQEIRLTKKRLPLSMLGAESKRSKLPFTYFKTREMDEAVINELLELTGVEVKRDNFNKAQHIIRAISPTAHEAALGSRLAEMFNWVNRPQEIFMRRWAFDWKINQIAKQKGIDLNVQAQKKLLTEQDIEKAADFSLEMTFAQSAKTEGVRNFIRIWKGSPLSILNPFPRFLVANAIPFTYEHSPLGFMKLFQSADAGFKKLLQNPSVAAGNMEDFIKTNPEEFSKIMSRAMLGTTAMWSAWQWRDSIWAGPEWNDIYLYPEDNDKKSQVDKGDLRAYAPLSAPLMITDAVQKIIRGEWKISDATNIMAEISGIRPQGVVSPVTRALMNPQFNSEYLVGMVADWVASYTNPLRMFNESGLTDGMRSFYEDIANNKTPLLIPATTIRVLRYDPYYTNTFGGEFLDDLFATANQIISPETYEEDDLRRTIFERFFEPALRNTPLAVNQPTQTTPFMGDPSGGFDFAVMNTPHSFSRWALGFRTNPISSVELELDRLKKIKNGERLKSRFYLSEGTRTLRRVTNGMMGQLVDRVLRPMVENTEYLKMSDQEKILFMEHTIKTFKPLAFKFAMTRVPGDMIEHKVNGLFTDAELEWLISNGILQPAPGDIVDPVDTLTRYYNQIKGK